MTAACRELEPLLALRTSGDLTPADAARLEAHLETCAACRGEAVAYAEALARARLPEPSAEERAALADLPARALAALRAGDVRRRTARWSVVAGAAAAAAAAALLLAPAALRDRRPPRQDAPAAEWEVPEATALWDEAGTVDEGSAAVASADASASSGETWNDAALEALDAADGGSDSE